jgi:plastocyanin
MPVSRPHTRTTGALYALAPLVALGACARPPAYLPRTREMTVTTVPLLVREATNVYPFLTEDFAAGGVLEGKEVYAFSPSSLTVVQGDTVQFTLINPEDDEHAFLIPGCTTADVGSFVLPDCGVDLPPQRVTHATYIARRAGIYSIYCKVTKHLPMMWGQLVVLSPAAMAGATE